MKTATSTLSMYDLSDDWAGVDVWESPGILAAAEASEAEKETVEIEKKLKREKENHAKLMGSAKGCMDEMASLLKSVEMNTATKEELERISKMEEEMKRLKVSLTESKSAIKSYSEDMVKSMSKTKSYDLMKTAKEHDIRSVIRFVRDAETVDLAFLLDCTGSMGSYINAAKSSIKEIVRRIKRTNTDLKFRVAIIGYRDICDGIERFDVLDFTSSVEVFENFVGKLAARGGGDAPEDIAGAVQKANSLSWQQTSRITFLIADAPCHGRMYHDCDDSYPDGTPGICIQEELKKLMIKGGEAGMQLHFGRITGYCDKMIRVFGEKGINFDVCDLKDPSKLASSVASSVRKSISKSVTTSKSKSRSSVHGDGVAGVDKDEEEAREYTIQPAKPTLDEWKNLKMSSVKVLCNKPIKTVNDLKAPLLFGMLRWGGSASSEEVEEKSMLMRRAKNPFAEGEMRLAYYGKLGMDETTLVSGKGDKILKTFKKKSKKGNNRQEYLAQMEVSTIAHFLAQEYNESSSRPSHCPKIQFLTVLVVEEKDSKCGECYCAEGQLPCAATSFTKYSNNTGYWNEDEINQSLLLFTCFTFEKTGGYLMVTDLQGVRNGNEFILTDPAILCRDKTRFGGTNLGEKFIEKCMNSTKAMLEEYGWDA